MLSFEGVLTGIEVHVVYKKKQIKGGRYLYTFKDAKKAAAEEASYLANAQKNRSFSPDGYAKKEGSFWSDTAYVCYEDR
ncbi:hypothetical protein [Hungatella hathewayi]|uniref:hypothetical protein n=1 Tax=Hungatella hathewayi TaxID=154046 RepID=UPI00356A4521